MSKLKTPIGSINTTEDFVDWLKGMDHYQGDLLKNAGLDRGNPLNIRQGTCAILQAILKSQIVIHDRLTAIEQSLSL